MIGRMGRPAAVAALVVALGAVAAGCMPAPVTEQGRAVRDLWGQFLVAAALVGGLVWILITISIVRFRRRGPDPSPARAPQAAAGSAALELLWTGGPIAIVLVLFWLTLGAMGRIDARSAGGVTVDVTAYRWQWRFDYPDLGVTVQGGPGAPAEMVVPVGEPIHIVLTSADVAHAFYVPQFLFKRDAIPGRTTEFDVTISEPGGYGGQCAEFCGVFHDRMLLTVRAETRADFDAWVASRRASAGPAATASGSAAP